MHYSTTIVKATDPNTCIQSTTASEFWSIRPQCAYKRLTYLNTNLTFKFLSYLIIKNITRSDLEFYFIFSTTDSQRLSNACIRISFQDYTAKIMTYHKWKYGHNRTEVNKHCISTVNKLSLRSVNCPPLMTFWFPSGNNRLSESNFAVTKIYRKTLVYFLQNLHFLEFVPLQTMNLVSVNNVS